VTDAFSDRVDGLSMPNRERIVDLHGKNQRRILAAAADAEQAKSADKAAVQEPYTELEFPSQESYRYIILSRIANVSDPAGAQDLKDLWNQTKAQRKKLGITGAKSRETSLSAGSRPPERASRAWSQSTSRRSAVSSTTPALPSAGPRRTH
jgi:hypothetical protein